MIFSNSKNTTNDDRYGQLKFHKDAIVPYVVVEYDEKKGKDTDYTIMKNVHRIMRDKIELDCITPRGIKHSFSFGLYNFCDICVYNIVRYSLLPPGKGIFNELILEHDTHKIRVKMSNGCVIRADTSRISELWDALLRIENGDIKISSKD